SCVIGHDHLVAVVAPIHPWAEDESIRSSGVDAEQLAATALLVREEGPGTREVLATALAPRPVAEPAMVLHSNAAVRTAVAGGAGCALLSELVVAADLREGRLVRIPVRGVNLRRSLRAVWDGPPPERLEPSLRALRGATARGGRAVGRAPCGRMSQNVRVNAAVSDPPPTENSGAAEAQQRIAELTAQIEQAIEDYYIHDAPTMADADYDRLELEL